MLAALAQAQRGSIARTRPSSWSASASAPRRPQATLTTTHDFDHGYRTQEKALRRPLNGRRDPSPGLATPDSRTTTSITGILRA